MKKGDVGIVVEGFSLREKPSVINTGIIKERVRQAFRLYKAGDLRGFVQELVDCADHSVKAQFHREIMDAEIEKQWRRL